MPMPLLRLAAIANCRPITTASMPRLIAIGYAMMIPAVAIPTIAPITVGTIVSANSKYVLRKTRFWASCSVVDVCPGAIIGVSGSMKDSLGKGAVEIDLYVEYGVYRGVSSSPGKTCSKSRQSILRSRLQNVGSQTLA